MPAGVSDQRRRRGLANIDRYHRGRRRESTIDRHNPNLQGCQENPARQTPDPKRNPMDPF
jgi:hypothetical protein